MKKFINKKMLATLLAAVMTMCVFTACVKGPETDDKDNSESLQNEIVNNESKGVDIGNGLEITDIGSYTGIYMEDGTDEVVGSVLMIVVKNTGDKTLQYGEINMSAGETTAKFTVSTLPVGQSAVLLEQSRLEYNKSIAYTDASSEKVAFFTEEPSKMEDTVKVQILDGVINVTNVSDSDIDGEIVVYYKNSASDLYYGGITYRSRVTGGLAKGETRQIAGAHASKSGSALMFVQII